MSNCTMSELSMDLNAVSYDEAVSEVEREIGMRVRCFPRWVDEGRVSKIDARDRLSRLKKALQLLNKPVDETPDAGTVPPETASDDVPY